MVNSSTEIITWNFHLSVLDRTYRYIWISSRWFNLFIGCYLL
jgi:hypothetical protein